MEGTLNSLELFCIAHFVVSLLTILSLREGVHHFLHLRRGKRPYKELLKSSSILSRITLSFAVDRAKRYAQRCNHLVLLYQVYCPIACILFAIALLGLNNPPVGAVAPWLICGKFLLLDLPFVVYYYSNTHPSGYGRVRNWNFR